MGGQRDVDCPPALLHAECVGKLPPLTAFFAQDPSTGPVVLDKDGNVAIKIQAKPGAKCNNITGNKKYRTIDFHKRALGSSSVYRILRNRK